MVEVLFRDWSSFISDVGQPADLQQRPVHLGRETKGEIKKHAGIA
jgi:hypothetical protein